jgi:hypothetical protein
MDDKEFKALKRVMKKLSSLKATLRKDEAVILDQLIFGEQEVQLHSVQDQGQFRILQGAQSRLTKGAQPRKTAGAQPRAKESASEMTLHSMTPRTTARKTPRSASKPSSRKQEAAPEIVLHGMQPAGRSANQAAKRIVARIDLNNQGAYSVTNQAER